MRRAVVGLMTAAMLVVAVAPLPAPAADRGVRVDDNIFDPVFLVVEPGTTVVWEHVGSTGHSVTPQVGSAEPRDSHPNCSSLNFLLCMQRGDKYRWTFNNPGTYTYYCRTHGSRNVQPDPRAGPDEQPCEMCGIVRVAGAVSPTASPTATVTASPSPTRTASPSAGPTPGPTVSPTVVAGPTVTAIGSPPGGEEEGGGGGGGRAGIAVLGVLALGGAGYLVWRFLIAPR